MITKLARKHTEFDAREENRKINDGIKKRENKVNIRGIIIIFYVEHILCRYYDYYTKHIHIVI